MKSRSRAAPRLWRGFCPPSFSRAGHSGELPRRNGAARGGTHRLGLQLLAPRGRGGHLRPAGTTWSHAAGRTGQGDTARHTGRGRFLGKLEGSGVRLPGRRVRAAEQMSSFYRVQVRSSSTLAAQRVRTPVQEHLPFFLSPSLCFSRPVPSLADEAPAGSYRPLTISLPLAPPDPDTQVPQFWPKMGKRASCPHFSLLRSLLRMSPITPMLSIRGTGTITATTYYHPLQQACA